MSSAPPSIAACRHGSEQLNTPLTVVVVECNAKFVTEAQPYDQSESFILSYFGGSTIMLPVMTTFFVPFLPDLMILHVCPLANSFHS